MCLRSGQWPQRLHDVEEMEKVLAEQHRKQLEDEAAARAAGTEEGSK